MVIILEVCARSVRRRPGGCLAVWSAAVGGAGWCGVVPGERERCRWCAGGARWCASGAGAVRGGAPMVRDAVR
ncbi:hypothetical protein GCM10010524_32500 [Streptomyces mexicanus]